MEINNITDVKLSICNTKASFCFFNTFIKFVSGDNVILTIENGNKINKIGRRIFFDSPRISYVVAGKTYRKK
jgi:hypothetical protein